MKMDYFTSHKYRILNKFGDAVGVVHIVSSSDSDIRDAKIKLFLKCKYAKWSGVDFTYCYTGYQFPVDDESNSLYD